MWTTENTLVLVGYLLLIGSSLTLVQWLERRTRLLEQVAAVKHRLTRPPYVPRYRTLVELDAGGQMAFSCNIPMSVGTHVSCDIHGHLAPAHTTQFALGTVLSQHLEVENE